jgi:hypothetical protein
VNALVHRRYDSPGKIVVSIEPESLRVTNPGGLMEGLDPLQLGTPGVKGYRNPVLADLFYGSGAMDKAGSGLVDVRRWMEDNNGRAVFGPDRENAKFEVILYRRPEMPHEVTGTASPQAVSDIFVGNLLELRELAESVCYAPTPVRRPAEIIVAHRGETIPVFALHDENLYTFSDLSCGDNPLRRHVTTNRIERTRLEDYARGEDGRRRLVRLFNEMMYRHLTERGLVLDKKRKRAHFPRTAEGVREVTYQARFRKATRTVTRPILSRVDGGIRYWEHEALRFQFNRYGSSWVLLILPCYVFTRDGDRKYLDAPKVGRLATRRAARDYNPQVDNDLVFWVSVLSAGEDDFRLGSKADSGPMVEASLISCEMPSLPPVAEGKEPSIPPDVDAEELEEEIAHLAEEEVESDDDTRDRG